MSSACKKQCTQKRPVASGESVKLQQMQISDVKFLLLLHESAGSIYEALAVEVVLVEFDISFVVDVVDLVVVTHVVDLVDVVHVVHVYLSYYSLAEALPPF